MIQANELRIGNLVYWGSSKDLFNIDPSHIQMCFSHKDDFNKMYKEIPLTEEWLVRFGLKLKPNHTAFHIGGMQFEIPSMIGGYYDNEYGLDEQTKIELKSVHQLQNLYYALTGEELKLNDK